MNENQNNPFAGPDKPGGEGGTGRGIGAAAQHSGAERAHGTQGPTYPPSGFERFRQWLGSSLSVQMFSIVVVVLLLLIPLDMTRDLVAERKIRQQEAIGEVGDRWGKEQTLIGPVLSIPYTRELTRLIDDRNETFTSDHVLHILPETLHIDAGIAPEVRRRGIFPVVVYHGQVALSGHFERKAFAHALPDGAQVHWDKAYLSMGLSDQRGIRDAARLAWNGRKLPFEPSSAKHVLPEAALQTGLPVQGLAPEGWSPGDRHQRRMDPVADKMDQSFQFDIPLKLDGSLGWHAVPVGKHTTTTMRADWPDPSFTGAFLPKHEIDQDGFEANWEVFHLNRPFAQLTNSDFGRMEQSAFGVSLLTPVDQYTQTERAVKYGVLIIALTFLALFLVQLLLKRHWHPVRYVLVGLALSLFYVLLLALAEKIGFCMAYGVAALATVGLITYYSGGAIRRKAALFGFGSALAAVYGFLFITLAAEDYALLIGALGLFVVLAAVMTLSRRMGVAAQGPDDAQPSTA